MNFFQNHTGNEKKAFFSSLKHYVYIYCSIDEDNRRIPIYIGMGQSDRCLAHLKDLEKKNDAKSVKIRELYGRNKLDIDIIAHKLDKETALAVESACIDLVGVNNLENLVKGHGDNVKRIPLHELANKFNKKHADIKDEHRGFVIIVNKKYKPHFNDMETLEVTRGIWRKNLVTIAENSDKNYAFAAYNGIIKEVYKVYDWVPAGTQEYFTREFESPEVLKDKFEFVGSIAKDIRHLYVRKLLPKGVRSYANAFIKL